MYGLYKPSSCKNSLISGTHWPSNPLPRGTIKRGCKTLRKNWALATAKIANTTKIYTRINQYML